MKGVSQPLALLLLLAQASHGQGFSNSGFESATVVSTDPPHLFTIYATTAIPSWTAYYGGISSSVIGYNAFSLGGAVVSLQDPLAVDRGTPAPLEGNYSVWLQAGFMGDTTPVAVGQTGTIPLSARSLTFWGDSPSLVMSFADQILNYTRVSLTGFYSVFAADISHFAGQTGELRFTAPTGARGVLDNIQFSTVPVPEPGVLSLTAIGALLLLGRRKRD